ncbi:DUF2935 domain-containing protein [Orenia marismortui]|uniref:DUF2935 family protein n=1 Tax=Orenia marismortui TaxID=46469 RepID=A0A4R8GQI2_9FIRM|nr:DUF2935 domain-containing protein [Orenia marismortui]TDX48032.1 hypothetical protein C7959_13318 [Orenia marismortui]
MNQEIFLERLNLIFWLNVFKEHTLFIKRGLLCEQKDSIKRVEEFYQRFSYLESEAQHNQINPFIGENSDLLEESIIASRELLSFKRELLAKIINCNPVFNLYPLILDHMSREAEEFLSLTTIYYENDFSFEQIVLAEESFWLRGMQDHLSFICHLLDPSERILISQVKELNQKFENLYHQSLDLKSMLQANPQDFPTVLRFTNLVIKETSNLYKFKERLRQLLAECKALSITLPSFAEHTAKEAEHFIKTIKQIKNYFRVR